MRAPSRLGALMLWIAGVCASFAWYAADPTELPVFASGATISGAVGALFNRQEMGMSLGFLISLGYVIAVHANRSMY